MPASTWEDSYYGTLGVGLNASSHEIREARRGIRRICPEKESRSEEDAMFFRQVKTASKCLLNKQRREIYDYSCNNNGTELQMKWQRKADKSKRRREQSEERLKELQKVNPLAQKSTTKRERRQMNDRRTEIWAQFLMDHYEKFETTGLQRKRHLRALPANGYKHELLSRLLHLHGLKFDCILVEKKKHKHELVKQASKS